MILMLHARQANDLTIFPAFSFLYKLSCDEWKKICYEQETPESVHEHPSETSTPFLCFYGFCAF